MKMRDWVIGVCALLTAQVAQAQNGRRALECTGTIRVKDINLEDPASSSERTRSRRTVFIIDEAGGKILTYATELARYEEFCPSCKKVWSATSVTWSDDHSERRDGILWYKSIGEGRLDWHEGTAHDAWLLSHFDSGDKETRQTKEHSDYPRCVKIDVDTYDFESLPSFLQQAASYTVTKKPAPRRAPLRKDWAVQSLPDGAELRYLPLPITKNDYPRMALMAAVEGTSIVSLQVDTSGHLVSCTTARSSGSPILDQQACRLYRERGRFELRGTTQPVTVQTAVQWVPMDRQ